MNDDVAFPSEQERRAFEALADVLAPGGMKTPRAGAIGVSGRWLDRVVSACPELATELRRVLGRAVGEEPETALRQLAAEDPDAFEVLALAIAGAYTMSPKVRRALGYPGQKPSPPYPDEADYYLSDGLLEPVLRRGAIYREVPEPAPGLDTVRNQE